MFRSLFLILGAVILLLVNICIAILKKQYSYAMNDEENYYIVYQRWIRTGIFMGTVILSLFTIYFASQFKYLFSIFFLLCEFVLVLAYTICKFKCITISKDEIIIDQLFSKKIKTKFSSIKQVLYIPNVRLTVKLKNKKDFSVSFNSDNFHKFYQDLLDNDVKFKTKEIVNDLKMVYLSDFNIKVAFPKTMFREFYQSSRFFRNSKYLFSARSLENHEYIEGHLKESQLSTDEFIDIVKNDLALNNFKCVNEFTKEIDGLSFKILKADDLDLKTYARMGIIYKVSDKYLVIYADYLQEEEDSFMKKVDNMFSTGIYGDEKNTFTKV